MDELVVDHIVAEAEKMAGTSDPDPAPFALNLELLVGSVNTEARLVPGAVQGTHWSLADTLRNRIDVSHWAHEHPEIRAEAIDAPLILTGLPRSGTTYFQYLFDRDPTMRMLRTWEGDRPCPPPAFDPESAQRRRDECAERALKSMDDPRHAEIAKIHLSDVDGPQECLKILDQTFANPGMYWSHRVPTYFDRLLDTIDLRAAYRHHKLELQLLQWRGAPGGGPSSGRATWSLSTRCSTCTPTPGSSSPTGIPCRPSPRTAASRSSCATGCQKAWTAARSAAR